MVDQRRETPDGAIMPRSLIRPPRRPTVEPEGKLSMRLALLLIAVLLAQILWGLGPKEREGSYTRTEETADLRLRMFLTASTINAYHDSAGQWPPSLGHIYAEEDGITYYPDELGYTLVGVSEGTTIEYPSTEDINMLPPGRGSVPGERRS